MKKTILILSISILIGISIFAVLTLLKPQTVTEKIEQISRSMKNSDCESNPNPIFTHHITDIEKLAMVVPPPSLVDGHLKAHSYLDTQEAKVPVYAPVDSSFVDGAFYVDQNSEHGEFMLDFEVSCEVSYRFDHITEPIDAIRNQLPQTPSLTSETFGIKAPIEFKAGDLIGYTTGTKYGIWDFGVYNNSKPNQFENDPQWNNSKIYTTGDCPFEYYTPELAGVYENLYGQHHEDPFEEFCQNKN